MTCIVGMLDKKTGDVFIGGDSVGINTSTYFTCLRSDPKVFVHGNFIYGFTTSFRMGQLLRFKFAPPHHPTNMETFEYMVSLFIDALRKCLKDGGFSSIKENVEDGGTFLVGYRGQLFTIMDDFQVSASVDEYVSIGCGKPFALGALYAVSTKLSCPKKIAIALEAAEKYSAYVQGPFLIKRLLNE